MDFGDFVVFTMAFFAALAGLIWLLTYLEQTLESGPQNRNGAVNGAALGRPEADVAPVQEIRDQVAVHRGAFPTRRRSMRPAPRRPVDTAKYVSIDR